MANNLRFLLSTLYKEEKIIVWAANIHIMNYTDQLQSKSKDFRKVILKSMGTVFTNDSVAAKSTYVLGFTSYQGKPIILVLNNHQLTHQSAQYFEYLEQN